MISYITSRGTEDDLKPTREFSSAYKYNNSNNPVSDRVGFFFFCH